MNVVVRLHVVAGQGGGVKRVWMQAEPVGSRGQHQDTVKLVGLCGSAMTALQQSWWRQVAQEQRFRGPTRRDGTNATSKHVKGDKRQK